MAADRSARPPELLADFAKRHAAIPHLPHLSLLITAPRDSPKNLGFDYPHVRCLVMLQQRHDVREFRGATGTGDVVHGIHLGLAAARTFSQRQPQRYHGLNFAVRPMNGERLLRYM